MKTLFVSGAILALALTGCATKTTSVAPTPSATTSPAVVSTNHTNNMGTKTFQCTNGLTVAVTYLSDEQIQLQSQGVFANLSLSPSASGAYYTTSNGLWHNQGGSWHEKSNSGVLSYKNLSGQTQSVTCTL